MKDQFSVWKCNLNIWVLITRQVLSFFHNKGVLIDIFFAGKLIVIYVIITVYHSHFAMVSETLRILIIMTVYFTIGVAIVYRGGNYDQQNSIELIEVIKNDYGIVLFFSIVGFSINFHTTVMIRYLQQELLSYFN